MAFGFDRLVAIFCGAKSIREVIAFPKTQKAACLVTKAPSAVDLEQLLELGLRLEDVAEQNLVFAPADQTQWNRK